MSADRIFRYVQFDRIPAYLAAGWDWEPAEPPASAYSVIMEWCGEGEPVEPDQSGIERDTDYPASSPVEAA